MFCSGPGSPLKEGAVVTGIVHSLVPGKGAVINLAQGKRGMLSVTNFSDNYDNADDTLSVGDYIKCSVVRCASDEKGHCVLSCRRPRSVLRLGQLLERRLCVWLLVLLLFISSRLQ